MHLTKPLIMAAFALAIAGLLLSTGNTQSENTPEDVPTTVSKEKAPEIAPKASQEQEQITETSTENKKEVTWRDNPNDCDTEKQYILAETFECKDKPEPTPVSVKTTAPTTTPQSASYNGSIEALIRSYDWNDEVALAIARCESGLNPSAIGDNYPINGLHLPSYGVFQIRGFADRGTPAQLLDAEYNVQFAYNMYKSQGWTPWTCYGKI